MPCVSCRYEVYAKGGCRHAAYTSICACGPSSAVLHYGHSGAPNDSPAPPGCLALLDMGAVYHGYCSDITCTVWINALYLYQGAQHTTYSDVSIHMLTYTS